MQHSPLLCLALVLGNGCADRTSVGPDDPRAGLVTTGCGPADGIVVTVGLDLPMGGQCDGPLDAELRLYFEPGPSTGTSFLIGVGSASATYQGTDAVDGEFTYATGHGAAFGDYALTFADGSTLSDSYEDIPVCPVDDLRCG